MQFHLDGLIVEFGEQFGDLGLAITAIALGVRQRRFERERLFWRLIGISLGAA